MYGGNWLVTKMKTTHHTLHRIIGIIFIIAGGDNFITSYFRIPGYHELVCTAAHGQALK